MASTIIFSLIFVFLSLMINVNSQTCQNTGQYSSCSSNSACGCLPFSFSDSFGICGVISTSNCSQFSRCQSPNDACPQGHVCVRHTRCDSSPICYPLTMVNERLCPLIIVSNYSSTLASPDAQYTRPGSSSSNHYYEAIQLIADRTGTYDITSLSGMDTHGFLYNGTFYPFNSSLNLQQYNDDGAPNNQFRLPVFLEAGVPYTLLVTTHQGGATGPFSVVATGPGNVQYNLINTIPSTTTTTTTTTRPSVINSYYSSALTIDSANYSRSRDSQLYYYQAIEVRVNTTGDYTFASTSNMDTVGYLYQGAFDPSDPTINKVTENDDGVSGGRDFRLTASLRPDTTYILVFTTYSQGVTGGFSVTASGPDDVSLIPINNYTE